MHITLVVATDEAGAIGNDGALLWQLPNDLKRFKQLTLGHPILMGRKTFESIGRPLPGRPNWVLTRDAEYRKDGVEVVHDADQALEQLAAAGATQVMVIGGGEIYRQLLPRADTVELTRVHGVMPQADTHFEWPQGGWVCTASDAQPADDRHAYAYTFETWERA